MFSRNEAIPFDKSVNLISKSERLLARKLLLAAIEDFMDALRDTGKRRHVFPVKDTDEAAARVNRRGLTPFTA